jgi:hypothetical protein
MLSRTVARGCLLSGGAFGPPTLRSMKREKTKRDEFALNFKWQLAVRVSILFRALPPLLRLRAHVQILLAAYAAFGLLPGSPQM